MRICCTTHDLFEYGKLSIGQDNSGDLGTGHGLKRSDSLSGYDESYYKFTALLTPFHAWWVTLAELH